MIVGVLVFLAALLVVGVVGERVSVCRRAADRLAEWVAR